MRLVAGILLFATAMTTALSVASTASWPATGAETAVAARATGPALSLIGQSPWVAPGGQFDLKLKVVDRSPNRRLGISVAVYPCLSSVSAFDQSEAPAGPTGSPISSMSTPVATDSLPQLGNGVVDLSMPVVVGQTSASPPAPFTIHLTSSGAQCGASPSGVYPVRVQLVDTSAGTPITSFTTHLVFTEAGSGTQRLRVAVVLPITVTLGPAAEPPAAELRVRPSAALTPPSNGAVAGVAGVAATAAERYPTVPLTFEPSGQTVDLIGPRAASLTELAASPAVHEVAAAPFVPVNASVLVASGLSSELTAQVQRGTAILAASNLHPGGTPSPGGAPDLGAWITNDGMDAASVSSLAADGYRQLVLPSSEVASPPTNGSTAQPFTVTGSRGSLTTLASNADLASRFLADPGNPVLAAHQLVAELAQLYYEKPNAITPRGVAVVAPSSWAADPIFVDALLSSLEANPMIQPVTVSALFDLFASPTSCRTGCRLLGSSTATSLPTAAIRLERQRIAGFAAAAPTAKALAIDLGDLVLAGESEALRPVQQSAVVGNAGAALEAQLGQLGVAGDRTVTLTSRQGTVPITIDKSAGYPVLATMTLTSDKLLFGPAGTTQWTQSVTLVHATNVYFVTVQTRTSGVFRVDISLRAPGGPLLLASGAVDVRSTTTSVVGIALTAGAVVVLAIWWVRTWVRRRAASDDGPADDDRQPTPVGR